MKFLTLFALLGFFSVPAWSAQAPNVKKQHKRDPLPLKSMDLYKQKDGTWAPNLLVDPSDFYEEMEIPKRSQVLEDLTPKKTS